MSFNTFPNRLKALVHILRDHDDNKVITRALRQAGHHGLACAVKELKTMTDFTKWRWGKLGSICKDLAECLLSLVERFPFGAFGHVRDEERRLFLGRMQFRGH